MPEVCLKHQTDKIESESSEHKKVKVGLPFFVELSFQPSNSNLNFTPAVFD